MQVSVEAGRQRNDEGVPAPVRSFKHAGFDDLLLSEVIRQGFEAPTPIQAQALPVVMSVSFSISDNDSDGLRDRLSDSFCDSLGDSSSVTVKVGVSVRVGSWLFFQCSD